MKAFSTRIKKIEAAVRERYGKVIQDMAEKKFIAALKRAPRFTSQ
jgi:hypothetical protein